jgi:hypothetical protein
MHTTPAFLSNTHVLRISYYYDNNYTGSCNPTTQCMVMDVGCATDVVSIRLQNRTTATHFPAFLQAGCKSEEQLKVLACLPVPLSSSWLTSAPFLHHQACPSFTTCRTCVNGSICGWVTHFFVRLITTNCFLYGTTATSGSSGSAVVLYEQKLTSHCAKHVFTVTPIAPPFIFASTHFRVLLPFAARRPITDATPLSTE